MTVPLDARQGATAQEQADHAGPLDGLRVIDMSTYVAGPSCGMTLAGLGAEVIRVDPLGGAPDTRRLPLGPDRRSLYWQGLNKGKRSVELDLASPEGRAVVHRLLAAEGGGVLVTNAPARDWLDFDELQRHREDVIVVRIVGHADGRPAVDYTVNCEVGLPLVTGPPGLDVPVNHVLPAWDLLCGMHAALAVLTAERMRRHTGRGQHVTLSLAEIAVASMCHLGLVADAVVNGAVREREGTFVYGSFGCDVRTSDGRRVMLVALTPRHWHGLIELTGVTEAVEALERALGVDFRDDGTRYTYREALAALIRPWFAAHTHDEVVAGLESARVLWGTYRTIEEFVADPSSLLYRGGLVETVEHPGATYPTPRTVLGIPGWRERSARVAPVLGQDTVEVVRAIAGLSEEETMDLQRRGVLGGPR